MKNQLSIRPFALAVFIFALSAAAFGQATDAYVSSTKSNVKNALTRAPMTNEILKGMQKVSVKAEGPGALFTSQDTKYGIAFNRGVAPTRADLVNGVNVGVLYVEAKSKDLPNGYYTINIKQVGTDATGKPQYGFTLTNTNGIQALSIGAKTNGAAGNSTGLGALRGTATQSDPGQGTTPTDPKIQGLSIGAKTNGAAGNTNGTGAKRQGMATANTGGTVKGGQTGYADDLPLGNDLKGRPKCPNCTIIMPLFKKTGKVETLSLEGLDKQIIDDLPSGTGITNNN